MRLISPPSQAALPPHPAANAAMTQLRAVGGGESAPGLGSLPAPEHPPGHIQRGEDAATISRASPALTLPLHRFVPWEDKDAQNGWREPTCIHPGFCRRRVSSYPAKQDRSARSGASSAEHLNKSPPVASLGTLKPDPPVPIATPMDAGRG